MSIQFMGEKLELVTERYRNDRLCVRLVEEDGCPFATISFNEPDIELPDDLTVNGEPKEAFLLKDWSENAEIAAYLINNQIIDIAGICVAKTGKAWICFIP